MARAAKQSTYSDPQLEQEFIEIYDKLNNINTENFDEGLGGDWVDYTPSWTGATADPAIGNGTIEGRYVRHGKIVTVTGLMLAGSTTTFGTGNWSWSMPITANGTYTNHYVGSVYVLNSGTAYYTGIVQLDTTTTASFIVDNTGGQFNSTRPMTWTTNDYFRFTITYEAA